VRFFGAVLVIVGAAAMYFMAYKGMTIDQARTRLATLLNLPGLAPPVGAAGEALGTLGKTPVVNTPGGGTDASGRAFNPRGNLGSR
jgi:hypothetical protein